MKVSISKSVGRAFEILEVFRELRRPASATEIRRHIGCPHSSVVAVLYNLVDLDYLSYDRKTKQFFPTYRIYKVGTWVQGALVGVSTLPSLAEAIAAETFETTAIASRSSIFLNILQIYRGVHPQAATFPSGLGFSLCRSTTGLVVLSQLQDEEILRAVRYAARWSKTTKSDAARSIEQVMASITQIRQDGYGVGLESPVDGLGCVVYPLPSPNESSPLVISVNGSSNRIKANLPFIRETMERYLKLHADGVRDFSPAQIRKSTGSATARHGAMIVQKMPEPVAWRM